MALKHPCILLEERLKPSIRMNKTILEKYGGHSTNIAPTPTTPNRNKNENQKKK